MNGQAYPNHLAAWRTFRHMTQEELADIVGCSVASIGHWETGARRLTDKWLPQLAEALNTSVGYIMQHDPENLPTDILDIWADIPTESRAQALKVLESFKRTGTGG
ncbi:helix-turn-helix domain-containing protein [Brevundimonas bullata]|nr:helix-turn-helix transcriptional regulator [Brevundimonas bullata]